MKIAVVGAGAMGSLFAWHMHRAGAEVHVFDLWQVHVDAINERGLLVAEGDGETAVPLQASSNAASIGPVDMALIFVKYRQTADILRLIGPLMGPQTRIVTLQNGIGNVELIRAAFPAQRLLYGLTTLTSELHGPGRIEPSYQGAGETCLWPLDGQPDDGDRAICEMLVAGGVNARIDPEIDLRIWKKLVINCCLNTLCAVTGVSVGALASRPAAALLFDGLVAEIVAVAQARGIAMEREATDAYLRLVAQEAAEHFPSMLIDIRDGRLTEIDSLNGAISREGRSLGIATPVNDTVGAMIGLLEQGQQR